MAYQLAVLIICRAYKNVVPRDGAYCSVRRSYVARCNQGLKSGVRRCLLLPLAKAIRRRDPPGCNTTASIRSRIPKRVLKMDHNITKTALDALNAKVSLVSAGYSPVSSCMSSKYKHLLNEMASHLRDNKLALSFSKLAKRRTPLVNAGYAIRVSIVTKLLYEWLHHLSLNKEICANVILLGGGLDVIGLWLCCVAEDLGITLSVYDLDCAENVQLKCSALSSMGVLQLGGESYNHGTGAFAEYSLHSVDLKNIADLDQVLLCAQIRKDIPTIAVSELVLAYLGTENSEQLIRYIATSFDAPKSAFLAYEPLESVEEDQHQTKSFSNSYYQRFSAKLRRGQSATSKDSDLGETLFCTLGSDCVLIEKSFGACGFGNVCAFPAGAAARNCCSDMRAPELFDEHAALALHLQCYCCVCAFSHTTQREFVSAVVNQWVGKYGNARVVSHVVNESCSGIQFTIKPIEKFHQEPVRHLYTTSYSCAMAQYPAVSKMVKTALKSDLSGKQETNLLTKAKSCAIWEKYTEWEGGFWVACLEPSGAVVGCIGIRKCSEAEGSIRGTLSSDTNSITTYEVHRLVVDETHRGRGIGKALMLKIENFVQSKTCSPYKLIAATPTIMNAANHLYINCGFSQHEDQQIGNLTISTYMKTIYG